MVDSFRSNKKKGLQKASLSSLVLLLSLSGCGSDNDPEVDTLAPVISLNGESTINVFQNSTYVDASATATDEVDGSVDVSASGVVDTTTQGDYVITYSATDAAGNTSSLERTVTVSPAMLSGTAAAGAAIIGTVTVKGALGVQKSQLIEADGSYEVDVTGLTAPYRLRAQGTVGGKTYQLHSYSETATIDATVNITPFTDLIVANAAHQVAASFFESTNDTSILPEELAAQENALQEKLQDVFTALGVDAAIDLLNTSFSADHSGLDAALDVIQIESTAENIMTITNLIDGTSITDDVTASDDNDESLTVDAEDLQATVSDTQAIANLFDSFSAAYVGGLPSADDITNIFSSDFLNEDETRAEFITDITTDPSMTDIGFASVSISDLDIESKTAVVHFNVIFEGVVDPETEMWLVAKDDTLGWQLRGNQQIVDLDELGYHCNDYDGTDEFTGGCGINVSISDDNFTNNGTDGAAIKSATVNIIDSTDGTTVKATVYLGNPDYSASELHVYNDAEHHYSGDYMAFGTTAGTIDPSIFSVGDIIEYNLYTAELDISTPSTPAVVGDSVMTYTGVVEFEAATVGLYPTASAATIEAVNSIASLSEGEDLTVEWSLATGTVIDEVLVAMSGVEGNYSEYWDDDISRTATSITVDYSVLNAELFSNENFDFSQGYTFLVRIYASDAITGQFHSTDYRVDVPASNTNPDPAQTYDCSYDSGWDDVADLPVRLDSFANFGTVTSDCGEVMSVTAADFAGKVFVEGSESQAFNNDGSATKANPSTGEFNDGVDEVISFEWYIETVNANSYLIIYTSATLDADFPAGFELRDTMALTSVVGTKGTAGAQYFFKVYSEQSNFDGSDMTRLTGADGEIWGAVFTQQ